MNTELSLRPDANDASFWLDVVRFVAAEAVVIGHGVSIFRVYGFLDFPSVPYIQSCAVVVFFLLSGFLIAHTIRRGMTRPGWGFREYTIDRVARIYSGYLPALFFIAIVDTLLLSFPLEPLTFLGNAFMLQEFPSRMVSQLTGLPEAMTTYGSGRPLWTLAIEMWIYLFVGSVVLLGRAGYSARNVPVIAICSVVPLYNLFGGRVTGLFGCWLFGAAVEHACAAGYFRRMRNLTLGVGGALLVAAWCALVWRNGKNPYVPSGYAFLAAGFAAILALTLRQRFAAVRPNLRSVVSYLAGFSFTLYLVHYTILVALEKHLGAGEGSFWAGFAVSNAIALGLSHLTERHHKRLGAWMSRTLGRIETVLMGAPRSVSGSL